MNWEEVSVFLKNRHTASSSSSLWAITPSSPACVWAASPICSRAELQSSNLYYGVLTWNIWGTREKLFCECERNISISHAGTTRELSDGNYLDIYPFFALILLLACGVIDEGNFSGMRLMSMEVEGCSICLSHRSKKKGGLLSRMEILMSFLSKFIYAH